MTQESEWFKLMQERLIKEQLEKDALQREKDGQSALCDVLIKKQEVRIKDEQSAALRVIHKLGLVDKIKSIRDSVWQTGGVDISKRISTHRSQINIGELLIEEMEESYHGYKYFKQNYQDVVRMLQESFGWAEVRLSAK